MSERYYSHVHAHLDPDLLEEYPNGIRIQEIELIFTDDPEVPCWRQLTPAVCHLDARRARELAVELLLAAQTAEQCEQAR
jgi:hypothetical protein